MTTAATTALNRIATALEEMLPLLERLAQPLLAVEAQDAPDDRCWSLWSVDPYIRCIRDSGHPGPCQSACQQGGETYAWGNYNQRPEPILDDDPERECADVSEARRKQ